MALFARFKYQFILFLVLLSGLALVYQLLQSNAEAARKEYDTRLLEAREEAELHIRTAIDVYSTLVSSIRSYVNHANKYPTEDELFHFLKDLIRDTRFQDSIVVSWVDTNQVFRYSVTPFHIDPYHLKGVSVVNLRPPHEVAALNRLMFEPDIQLFPPINLVEGWAGFPFNFSVFDEEERSRGYFAPIVNVKYLLNRIYANPKSQGYVYRFSVNDSIYFNREKVLNRFHEEQGKKDPEDFRNYPYKELDFIGSEIDFYNLKIKVEVAHKEAFREDVRISGMTYAWYVLLIIISVIVWLQYVRHSRLNAQLVGTQKNLNEKNQELESQVNQIQTLIKEVHHRVKNNLQIIASLLNLQRMNESNEEVIRALLKSKNRIQSMALVHQKLYGNEHLTNIYVREYLEQLMGHLEGSFLDDQYAVENSIEVPNDMQFGMDTMIPLGLILNELLTNSYKYAFEEGKVNSIRLKIQKTEEHQFVLIYADSGPGISEDIDVFNSGTLGLELITILSEQIGGELQYLRESSEFRILFRV
ncbi:MAG: sensor histidine kinase [Bacteroidetes bacterium]|nr:MAG: sensor histidine kinase [Bacteroidota bacterium]